MTTYDYGTTAPPETGTGGTREQAQQAASTAADESRRVADVAKDEARSVASDAQEQARNLVDDARSQLEEQSRGQLDNLLATLQTFADDLGRMTRGESPGGGLAQDLVSQVGDHARSLSSQLEGREPAELLEQARGFARRRPGTFLLGALAAGVVAGRLARGAKDAHSDGGTTTGTTTTTTTSSAPPIGAHLASSGQPATGTASMPPAPQQPTQAVPPSPAPAAWPASGTATDDPLAGTGAPTETPVYPADGPAPGGTR